MIAPIRERHSIFRPYYKDCFYSTVFRHSTFSSVNEIQSRAQNYIQCIFGARILRRSHESTLSQICLLCMLMELHQIASQFLHFSVMPKSTAAARIFSDKNLTLGLAKKSSLFLGRVSVANFELFSGWGGGFAQKRQFSRKTAAKHLFVHVRGMGINHVARAMAS